MLREGFVSRPAAVWSELRARHFRRVARLVRTGRSPENAFAPEHAARSRARSINPSGSACECLTVHGCHLANSACCWSPTPSPSLWASLVKFVSQFPLYNFSSCLPFAAVSASRSCAGAQARSISNLRVCARGCLFVTRNTRSKAERMRNQRETAIQVYGVRPCRLNGCKTACSARNPLKGAPLDWFGDRERIRAFRTSMHGSHCAAFTDQFFTTSQKPECRPHFARMLGTDSAKCCSFVFLTLGPAQGGG